MLAGETQKTPSEGIQLNDMRNKKAATGQEATRGVCVFVLQDEK